MKDNIVLIGLPGAGKSTLGVVLAKIVNFRFLDCDLLIQEQEGQTLQEIIDARGARGFIEVENAALKRIEATRTVISTGGSAVYSAEAMEHLRSIGTVVHLRVSCDEMVRRLGNLDERGVVLRDGKAVALPELYEERMPLYERYADITLDVTDAQFREAAIELKGIMEGQGLLEMPLSPRRGEAFRHWRDEDLTYNMERQISFDMLDCNRHLKAAEALRLFGDAANSDFADIAYTHQQMIEQGYYFIITRASCRKLRDPKDEGRVTVRTWPHQVKGMQVTRNFEVVDAQGEVIMQCESSYLIIDAKAGRPIRIQNFPMMEMYEVDRPVEVGKRQRIKLTDDMFELARVMPRFSDLDANGHVTNTHYPTFAWDFLPPEIRDMSWVDFQIEFAAEMKLGDEVVLHMNDAQAAIEAGDWVKVVGAQPDGTTNFGCLFRF
ncbi:MAG: shikimate kinase [Coriobacteriaceae bacterium]|nr:shikimate kinase [Coriobacteriaceae bacterium]